jgi:endonuclease/exonuclease/phosphatase family metal-dependent hydrolase
MTDQREKNGAIETRLRVLSWNLWWRYGPWESRRPAIAATLARLDADVIALQEVTPPLLDMLAREPWVRDRYGLSDVDGTTFTDYGVVLLSRLPVERTELHELPSHMDRAALVIHLPVGAICTGRAQAAADRPARYQGHLRGPGDLSLGPKPAERSG